MSDQVSLDALLDAGFCNLELVEDLLVQYQKDPTSVDSSWRDFFASMNHEPPAHPRTVTLGVPREAPSPASPSVGQEGGDGGLRVLRLIQAYRTHGHLMAQVNPIATEDPVLPEVLQLTHLGFSEEDLGRSFPTCGLMSEEEASLQSIIETLQDVYCRRIGIEYMEINQPEMHKWLQERIEPSRLRPSLSIDQKKRILQQLNRSELLEVFLHTKYTGQKRFSLEGGETLIPILGEALEVGGQLGISEVVLGMAHRGRLNVLTNIFQKSYSEVFCEFEEGYISDSFEGTGDVKYHKGYESDLQTESGHTVRLTLPDNPSHLEAVNPVVEGIARAKQIRMGNEKDQSQVLPIVIHGDAAIAGQGVVYETMQLCQIAGYSSGGTLHVVINNQIGFTTLPKDGRSTVYCTDVARTFGAPVFHVNGEDPEGCVHAVALALELRQRYHCDVIIELNCYRKYGHNEGDEPAFTQPLEYQLIRKKKPVRELYREELIHQGVLEKALAEKLEGEFKAHLQEMQEGSEEFEVKPPDVKEKSGEKSRKAHFEEIFRPIKTGVQLETLRDLARNFCTVPEGFEIHRKLKRLLDSRLKMVEGDESSASIDWGMAEHLAFASLLSEGVHVRLSGQDSRRGTFSHRHSMWMEQKTAKRYSPLSHLSRDQGRFDVFNSPLSEYAVLGFEFGYTLAYPEALVMWEAQFGDFSNGAQIIIDQFISTSEQKWGRASGLVMLLPHGYEGQGPEHSSARMERFLQLSGDANMQVVNPSTPAQFFHLLRRQSMRKLAKPLIVFTPKGLLRHPRCLSAPQDLASGEFCEILDDPIQPKKAKKLLLCSGRVFYDLWEEREKLGREDVAILRIEQLYPLNVPRCRDLIRSYSSVKKYCWVQEEPSNMGAWDFIRPWLVEDLLPEKASLHYAGRPRSAAPAVGSTALHRHELEMLKKEAFK